jgi:hypothetical protein
LAPRGARRFRLEAGERLKEEDKAILRNAVGCID